MLNDEFRDFIRSYYLNVIDKLDITTELKAVIEAWNEIIYYLDYERVADLEMFTISEIQQQDYITSLEVKYGAQFDVYFHQVLVKKFEIGEREYCHAMKYDGLVGLTAILKEKEALLLSQTE